MIAGAFAQWQPRYARHGVATFPLEIIGKEKKPMISNYGRVGLRGSGQLALKFPEAQALGFMAGRRTVFVTDLDSRDEQIIRVGEKMFGRSPLLWRTGGGKFAAAYAHHGETRLIRPIPDLPIDVLGGGVVVAPGSIGELGPYEIIRGSLDDLDRLPYARIPDEIARQMQPSPPRRSRRPSASPRAGAIPSYSGGCCDRLGLATIWMRCATSPKP